MMPIIQMNQENKMKKTISFSDLSTALKWFVVLGWITILTWGLFYIGFIIGSLD